MSHVPQVLQQLSLFQPNPKMIKSKIESLIEREYLMRDPNNASSYQYVA